MTMDYKKVHYLYIMVYKYSPKPSSLILRSISSSSLKSAEPFETPRSFGPRLRIYEIRKLHIEESNTRYMERENTCTNKHRIQMFH